MKKKVLALILATVTVVGLTACGSSKSEVPTVVAGLETGIKPLSYIDDNNKPAGYEVELVELLNEKIPEYNLTYELVSDDATEIGLDTGKYAFIGGGLYKTAARQEKYLFPEQATGASIVKLFARGDNTDIHSLDDLVGKTIVPPSPNGGIYNLLTQYNEEHPDAQLTFATREGAEIADMFKEVDDGTYDALVLPDNLDHETIISGLGLNVKIADEAVKVNPTYIVFGKNQQDVLDKVNKALAELAADGTLAKLNEKWFGENKLAYLD